MNPALQLQFLPFEFKLLSFDLQFLSFHRNPFRLMPCRDIAIVNNRLEKVPPRMGSKLCRRQFWPIRFQGRDQPFDRPFISVGLISHLGPGQKLADRANRAFYVMLGLQPGLHLAQGATVRILHNFILNLLGERF